MWGAPQKVGKWICFKSSCLGWGDGEAADMLSGILPSLHEHLELKAILPGKWAACSFLWPAAFSRVSLQVTHTRIAMLTRGASNSRYNTTTQKLKDLPQDPVSSRLRTGLSLWTWQDWHTTPPPSIPSRIANAAAQPSLLDALNKGPKDLLPLHGRSYLSSLYLTFLSLCWHDILPVLFLMNLKIIVSQVSGLVCFWTLSVTFAVRKRKRMQGRTLGRGKSRDTRRWRGPKSQLRHHSPQCPSPGDAPKPPLQGATKDRQDPTRTSTLPLPCISSLTNLLFLCIAESAFLFLVVSSSNTFFLLQWEDNLITLIPCF